MTLPSREPPPSSASNRGLGKSCVARGSREGRSGSGWSSAAAVLQSCGSGIPRAAAVFCFESRLGEELRRAWIEGGEVGLGLELHSRRPSVARVGDPPSRRRLLLRIEAWGRAASHADRGRGGRARVGAAPLPSFSRAGPKLPSRKSLPGWKRIQTLPKKRKAIGRHGT
ncbi:hypothetical protein EJB05_38211, partial [Eragrostis curvula]